MARGLALALALLASPSAARECGEGRVRGGTSVAGDAIENYECAMLGRIYCRLAEDRDAGVGQDAAVRLTSKWLAGVARTGSNLQHDWRPIVAIAAGDVYGNAKRRPGPTYYRAVYGCGLSRRIGNDADEQRRAGKVFELAAKGCEQSHVLKGQRSFPNDGLKRCLAKAVDEIAPAVQP